MRSMKARNASSSQSPTNLELSHRNKSNKFLKGSDSNNSMSKLTALTFTHEHNVRSIKQISSQQMSRKKSRESQSRSKSKNRTKGSDDEANQREDVKGKTSPP